MNTRILPCDMLVTCLLAGLPTLCECVARRNFVVFVSGDNVNGQRANIEDAIESAWRAVNAGKSAQ